MPRGRIGAAVSQRGYETSRRRRAAMALLTTSTLVCVGAMETQPARAGTYVMRSCDVPGRSPAPLGPWVTSSYTPEPTPKMIRGGRLRCRWRRGLQLCWFAHHDPGVSVGAARDRETTRGPTK